jgi:hypothetical protein
MVLVVRSFGFYYQTDNQIVTYSKLHQLIRKLDSNLASYGRQCNLSFIQCLQEGV